MKKNIVINLFMSLVLTYFMGGCDVAEKLDSNDTNKHVPVFNQLSYEFNVTKNTTVVGVVEAADADEGSKIEYSVTPNLFLIDINSGAVIFKDSPKFNNRSVYNPVITAFDFDDAILSGEWTRSDGIVLKGRFKWNDNSKRKELVEGTVIYPNGHVLKGIFEWSSNTNSMELVNGEVTLSDGIVLAGTFKAGTFKRELVNGTVTYPNGDVLKGRFEWNTELKK